jgi:hypothetical protein
VHIVHRANGFAPVQHERSVARAGALANTGHRRGFFQLPGVRRLIYSMTTSLDGFIAYRRYARR